jgi:hypothetical protein
VPADIGALANALDPIIPSGVVNTAARMFLAAAANTPSSWAAVPLDTVHFDPSSSLVLASHTYVCKTAGYYQIDGTVSVTSTAGAQGLALAIAKNGAIYTQMAFQSSSAWTFGATISDIVTCAANDSIGLWWFTTIPLAANAGSSLTAMAVVKVG